MRSRFLLAAVAAMLTVTMFAGSAMAQDGAPQKINWFDQFVVKGGVIAWLILAIDVLAIGLIIEHFLTIRKGNLAPEDEMAAIEGLFAEKKYREVIEYTAGSPSFFAHVMNSALSEAPHGYGAMERAMEEANEERTTKLLRKIEGLNIIGNIAPMLGLFGTVYGMILTFGKIVEAGGMPKPDQLADSIGVALVTTFWGLFVAMPALAVYAYLRNRIDALSAEIALTSQELVGQFRPGAKKAAKGAAPKSATPPAATDTTGQGK